MLHTETVQPALLELLSKIMTDPLFNEFRLASKEDIGAMKLNAIAGRGSKKDFIDLYFLLNEFSLEELIGFYRDKYQDGSEFLVLKSLSYFADADTEPTPLMLKDANWDKIKNQIANSTKNYMK
ncbi:Nucleotidyl transferase AbiEii toxin, Type IV TA system [Belliella buryatensis]|uniref:Nucleotidyl transferase AbiEii toxin, Type IV TA system n=2 Tax=Belliella buryatensis TaxID=1500549 RepID=A0A239CTD3_9BACT|nr:Nucleotidyl transferase AbiEii toxin, Type IV TA system [Belliella buryatensis]